MSGWQTYIDKNLVGTGKVDTAGIYDINTGAKWAASTGFNCTAVEVKAVIAAFKDPSTAQQNGLLLNTVKYMFLGGQEPMVNLKKVYYNC
jgi:profilin